MNFFGQQAKMKFKQLNWSFPGLILLELFIVTPILCLPKSKNQNLKPSPSGTSSKKFSKFLQTSYSYRIAMHDKREAVKGKIEMLRRTTPNCHTVLSAKHCCTISEMEQ